MYKGNKILITGGQGFLGRVLVKSLEKKGYNNLITFSRKEYDLTKESDVKMLFSDNPNVDVVLHLAGDTGGIGYNKKHPGKIFLNNIMINTLMQEYSRLNNVKKFVGVGTVCSYPKFTDVPFKEEDLWQGYPEETNAAYGLSKKMMLVQSQAYRQEYNFNGIHLLMINLYGPEDDFDLENSHVIAGLIRKFVEAKEKNQNEVVLWGDGSPSREFLYVDDAAEAIILAMEKYNSSEPVNIGSGQEITIKDLAELIKKIVGFNGKIVCDTTKPNGQPRRGLNTKKAEKLFGFKARISLEDGLKKTIEWYQKNAL